MPRIIVSYVRIVEAVNYRIGRMAMYLIFVLMAILIWSSISKTFFSPALWTLETAQFVMVAYYLLGGPYSMQLNAHVRMDLVYGSWSIKTKAWVDAFTIFGLIFYLVILLQGAIGSTAYSLGQPYNMGIYEFWGNLITAFFTGGPSAASEVLGYMERSASSFRPYLWPIKSIATLGIFLMLLQAIAVFFKDVATIRGEEL
ncbi:MAG: TRAP transporter small permease subunit [Rhodobacteraceae bacterium]|nr:TRAP transporter small permease subunit [Paracoccaceae bacterium]